jgi:hypothetical protein
MNTQHCIAAIRWRPRSLRGARQRAKSSAVSRPPSTSDSGAVGTRRSDRTKSRRVITNKDDPGSQNRTSALFVVNGRAASRLQSDAGIPTPGRERERAAGSAGSRDFVNAGVIATEMLTVNAGATTWCLRSLVVAFAWRSDHDELGLFRAMRVARRPTVLSLTARRCVRRELPRAGRSRAGRWCFRVRSCIVRASRLGNRAG